MEKKQELIDKILDKEHAMFLAVPADGEYSCREDEGSFRLHRGSQFITWSEETLASYLRDLSEAESSGTNLMTLKYARMDDLIPPVSVNSLVGEITNVQKRWQREMFGRYPNFMAGARPLEDEREHENDTSFERYLRSELETYSDETLASLKRDIDAKLKAGINMPEESYEYLVRRMGYGSLKDAEERLE